MKKEKCISCGKETQYDELEHIDHRYFYIEGVGQLCCTCYNDIYKHFYNKLFKVQVR